MLLHPAAFNEEVRTTLRDKRLQEVLLKIDGAADREQVRLVQCKAMGCREAHCHVVRQAGLKDWRYIQALGVEMFCISAEVKHQGPSNRPLQLRPAEAQWKHTQHRAADMTSCVELCVCRRCSKPWTTLTSGSLLTR